MKIFFWNIRGLANAPTRTTLKSLVRKHSPDFLCLVEPMTSLARIPDSFWRSIGMALVGVNDRGQSFPNLWLFIRLTFYLLQCSPPLVNICLCNFQMGVLLMVLFLFMRLLLLWNVDLYGLHLNKFL